MQGCYPRYANIVEDRRRHAGASQFVAEVRRGFISRVKAGGAHAQRGNDLRLIDTPITCTSVAYPTKVEGLLLMALLLRALAVRLIPVDGSGCSGTGFAFPYSEVVACSFCTGLRRTLGASRLDTPACHSYKVPKGEQLALCHSIICHDGRNATNG